MPAPPTPPLPSRAEIEAARHTRAQLAQWGILWPPPPGWRKRLLREADRRDGTGPKRGRGSKEYSVGEKHRYWPEWTWNGEAFVKTSAFDHKKDPPPPKRRRRGVMGQEFEVYAQISKEPPSDTA